MATTISREHPSLSEEYDLFNNTRHYSLPAAQYDAFDPEICSVDMYSTRRMPTINLSHVNSIDPNPYNIEGVGYKIVCREEEPSIIIVSPDFDYAELNIYRKQWLLGATLFHMETLGDERKFLIVTIDLTTKILIQKWERFVAACGRGGRLSSSVEKLGVYELHRLMCYYLKLYKFSNHEYRQFIAEGNKPTGTPTSLPPQTRPTYINKSAAGRKLSIE